MTSSCRKHDKTWTGINVCHCENGCGELFLTVRAFDAHRVGSDEHRRCDLQARDGKGRVLLQQMPSGAFCMAGTENSREKLSYLVRNGQSSE